MEGSAEELPNYSPNPGRSRSEHRYALQDKNGHEWLSFKVKSRAADSKHMPLFLEGDIIKGEVRLDLDRAETLKGLTITIRAATTAVGQEEEIFLDKTESFWTPASPREAKLVVGAHTHAFSISIPRGAMVAPASKATPKSYSLPPTFSERASPAYIDYKLYVTVRRGGLRVNSKLSTSFTFLPRTVADPPSPLRALVYAGGGAIAILGPDVDPHGWKVFDPVRITGTLFNARDVSVQSTLAVATPFSYASNSPVPLLLTFRGTDVQALDLFAIAPRLHLLRTIEIGSEVDKEPGLRRRSNNTFVSSVAKGTFWSHEAGTGAEVGSGKKGIVGTGDSGVLALQGELFIPKGTKQSFAFPRLACRYSVVLLPPDAPGFTSATAPDEPLLTEHITVTMAHAPGITPISQIPPGYEVRTEGNYNVATGFLENGNQRFLHLHGH